MEVSQAAAVKPDVNVCLTAEEATVLRHLFGELTLGEIANSFGMSTENFTAKRASEVGNAMYTRLAALGY